MSDWSAFPVAPAAPAGDAWAAFPPAASIDTRTGAPANVRAAVGAAQSDADRLNTLRRFAPDARPYGDGNFLYTDRRSGRPTIYNPKGLDWGDAASIGPEIGEVAGGAVGGALALGPALAAAPVTGGASLLAVPAGIGLGAAAGREVVGLGASMSGTNDTRGIGQRVMDAGTTAGLNAVAGPVGSLAMRGARAVAGPVTRMFGARTGVPALNDFANAGVDASAGAITGNRTVQLAEKAIQNTPGGAEPISALAERQASQLGDEAGRVAGLYGTPGDPAQAGAVLRRGAEGAVERFGTRQETLYGDAFGRIGAGTLAPFTATLRFGQQLEQQLAQAPASRDRVLRPVLNRIEALAADQADGGGGVPFEALRAIRTDLGRIIGGPPNAASAPSSDTIVYLRQLYGSITEDMSAVARAAGPEAERALSLADRYTRFNRTQNLPLLEKVIDKGTDQQVFSMAFPANGRPDAQMLARLRRNMQPDEWGAVSATVLDRMGMPTPGAAGAGDGFSVATFLTNWNKLRANGDGARQVLFGGGENARLAPELDRLARVADRIKDVERMSNPPGTARNLIAAGGIIGIGNELASGDVKGAGMIAGVGILAPRYAARLITSPQFVRWLAGAAPQVAANPAAQSSALARLGAVSEANPEIRDAIEAFRLTFSGTPASSPPPMPMPRRMPQ